MNFPLRRTLRRLLTPVLAMAVLTGCALSDGLAVGAVAPEPVVEAWVNTSPGVTPSVAANRGKHVLVEFWSMHCPHCRDAIPEMREIAGRYSRTDLEILSIHVPLGDHDDTPEMVGAFAQKGRLPYPVGVDRTGQTLEQYECGYLPHGALVGPDGKIVWAGSMSIYDVGERIREALGGGAAESGTVGAARATPAPAACLCETP